MSEQSKFSGALAKLNQRPAEAPLTENDLVPAVTPISEELKSKGRPHGKRSNPDYQPTTVLLRKQTKKIAARRLEDSGSGKDLSDLIEQLLSEWIQQPV